MNGVTRNEQGFKICPQMGGKSALIFDASRAKECIEYAIKNECKRIMLFKYHSPIPKGVDELLPLKDFINCLLTGSEKISYKNLEQFKNLIELSAMDNGVDTIDLNWFPNLNSLNCNLTNRLIGLENCRSLKFLQIVNCKPKGKNLLFLSSLTNLERLNIIQTSIQNLSGIESLENLKELSFYQASSLVCLEGVQSLCNNLSMIEIDKCKKIIDYGILSKIHSLRKIRISDSGEIKSLAFIKDLSQLESITFIGTTVLDGDLSYCERLSFVGFENKKHYSHKREQFKKNSFAN